MKVLFLDHPEADFLSGQVYLGLCQALGPENVVDYPYKKSYHGVLHEYPSVYDRNPGGTLWQSWQATDQGNVGKTGPFSWMIPQPGREWTEDEIVTRIADFDVVVLASPRPYNSAALSSLIRRIGRDKIRRLVMMDGEDYTTIRWDFVETYLPSVYFKREMVPDPVEIYPMQKRSVAGRVRVVPFPFASPLPAFQPVKKDIDVLFLGGGTWGGRNDACDALRREFGDRFVGGVGVHYAYPEYLDAINRAKIAICVRGFGYDTLRFWEIPSFQTMMVADKLPLIKPFPFQDGVHIAYFNDTQHLVETVRHYLSNDEGRERIAKAGHQWLREHHTAAARARQLLEEATK